MENRTKILQSIREHKKKFPNGETGYYPVQSQTSGSSPDELTEAFIQSLKTVGANVIKTEKDIEAVNLNKQHVFPGNFGVAENGAIWLEDKDLPNRIDPFITEHLFIKLNMQEIVPTMQEAYRRIDLKGTGFGVFISGPSKTADIEQSLVYGAHGAKEMTVLIY